MTIFARNRAAKMALRLTVIAGMTLGLSACYGDFGLGYASDGYDQYDCDPYSQFDSYYNCDYGYGFNNIGYGGGWYDNFYYPGHGIFLFDNFGRRYNMRDDYRRYWGAQRFSWQREHGRSNQYRGNSQGGYQGGYRGGYQGGGYYPQQPRRDNDRNRGHDQRDGYGHGNRDHDDNHHGQGNGTWQGGHRPQGAAGTPQGAVVAPQPTPNIEPGSGRDGSRGRGRGRDGDGGGRGQEFAAPQQRDFVDRGQGQGQGQGQGRGQRDQGAQLIQPERVAQVQAQPEPQSQPQAIERPVNQPPVEQPEPAKRFRNDREENNVEP